MVRALLARGDAAPAPPDNPMSADPLQDTLLVRLLAG